MGTYSFLSARARGRSKARVDMKSSVCLRLFSKAGDTESASSHHETTYTPLETTYLAVAVSFRKDETHCMEGRGSGASAKVMRRSVVSRCMVTR